MSTIQERLATLIPKRMRVLEKDPRGYPIPFVALRDKTGKAQFTINDARRTEKCRRSRLCSICGNRLAKSVWFIGGIRCFVLENGAFIDGPMHYECGEYALNVCPFLAVPNYSKRIDDALLTVSCTPLGLSVVQNKAVVAEQPECFGFGSTEQFYTLTTTPGEWLYFVDRWDYVEWWHNGTSINAPDTMPVE